MNYSSRSIFSVEHQRFADTVARFFRTEVDPNVKSWEAAGAFPRDIFRKAGAAGLLQPSLPEELGGGGGDFLHDVIVSEAQGYSAAAASLEAFFSTDTSSQVIWNHGTDAQKRYWIPKYATGDVVAEVSITEPQSGSDVGSVRTTAVRDGASYRLNGEKAWVSNLSHCDMVLVVARTDPSAKGTKGLSIFLVDTEGPGVARSKPIGTVGSAAGNVGTLFFDNAKIGADRLLGGVENEGLKQILTGVNPGRLLQAARWLAACETAFALTVDFVRDRRAFGQRVLDFQNTQFRLADMKTEITIGRAFVDQCLGKCAAGKIPFEETAMAKLWLSELESRVMDQCVQLHGGMGIANESAISRMWTAARVHRIFLGTSEMQRLAIAKTIV